MTSEDWRMFKIGQKVVCVDASSPPIRGHRSDPDWPVKGQIYTVADLRIDPSSGLPALQTEEQGSKYVWYQRRRFRPLVERKTDISIFTKILSGVRAGKVREIAWREMMRED